MRGTFKITNVLNHLSKSCEKCVLGLYFLLPKADIDLQLRRRQMERSDERHNYQRNRSEGSGDG